MCYNNIVVNEYLLCTAFHRVLHVRYLNDFGNVRRLRDLGNVRRLRHTGNVRATTIENAVRTDDPDQDRHLARTS